MTALPAFSVGLGRSSFARLVVALLATLALGGVIAWRLLEPPADPALLVALVAVIGVVCGTVAWHWPVRARRLRWSASAWRLGWALASPEDDLSGAADLVLDVGAWMLLRFRPDAPGRQRRGTWLAVQRASVDGSWHTLRCALYSPRPAAGSAAADELSPRA